MNCNTIRGCSKLRYYGKKNSRQKGFNHYFDDHYSFSEEITVYEQMSIREATYEETYRYGPIRTLKSVAFNIDLVMIKVRINYRNDKIGLRGLYNCGKI